MVSFISSAYFIHKLAMYMYKVIFRVTYGHHDTQNEGYTQHRRACAATSCTLSFSS
jgi:hypothetical protein